MSDPKPKKCKVCDEKTISAMNINFKAVPICNSCANSIMIQQATLLASKDHRESIGYG
jgi:hypothetical protein